MKFVHLSDLHIGKRVNDFSMLEDQEYILNQIISLIDEEAPEGVILAGDIYDKSLPSAEAVQLFDHFLVRLARRKLKVFVISGNHDSPERIAFGSRLMHHSGVYMSPVYQGEVEPVELSDEYGKLRVYMLPFIKPAHVRRFFPETEITDYASAVATAVEAMAIDPSQRNLLVAHQFVTGALRSESEDINVGGIDNVPAEIFEVFDYVALGHIHRPQHVYKETIRYAGTPLKYSFSEAGYDKSLTVIECREKGHCLLRTLPLKPLRDLLEIKGSYMTLTARDFYQGLDTKAYYHVTLTDEEDIPDAVGKLRAVYPNLMKLDYDNQRTRSNREILGDEDVDQKSPLVLFQEFYEQQNNQPLSEDQLEFTAALMETIWEGEV
ncbi:MAG: exonuclease sbcCD subunit D [delta proteobacterium ML8_F1]|nr:MAG: exonuclease sbcCD subunit D [delta proteobacterium ML8_F1]